MDDRLNPSLLNIINDAHDDNEIDVCQSFYYDDNEMINQLKQCENPVCIMSLNCQAINTTFDDVNILIEKHKLNDTSIDILCLQEVRVNLEKNSINQFNIPGYHLHYCPPSTSTQSGLIIYVNDTYQVKTQSILENTELWESLILEITLANNTRIIVGNIYRAPRELNNQIADFTEAFSQTLQKLSNKYKSVFLCGDYNLNLLRINDKPRYAEFFDTLLLRSFLPNITLPTRLHCKTLIDNIFTNCTKYRSISGILNNSFSDHQAIYTIIDIPTVVSRKKPYSYVVNGRIDYKLLKNKFSII